MNWKEQIGLYLSGHNLFRFKYLNTELEKTVDAWVAYLSEFEGITTSVTKEFTGKRPNLPYFIIAVTLEDALPFKMVVGYKVKQDTGLYLELKSATALHVHALTASSFSGSVKDEEGTHQYKVEELSEAEIFEGEYILQLFNNRLVTWMEKMKNGGHPELLL